MSIAVEPQATPGTTRLTGLAYVVTLALVITVAVAVWSLIVDLGRASYISDIVDRTATFSEAEASRQDDRVAGAAAATVVTLLVTGVMFIVWFRQVVGKLYAARPTEFRHSPGWAIGGWFVPFLNLARPKQMADDAWRAAVSRSQRVPPVFHLWWASYLIGSVVSAVGGQLTAGNPDDPQMLAVADRVSAAGDAIWAVAAVLAIVVVARLDRGARNVQPAPVQPAQSATSALVFNPPPGWPAPPAGWVPPPGWQPDPAWPPAPPGWQFWVATGPN